MFFRCFRNNDRKYGAWGDKAGVSKRGKAPDSLAPFGRYMKAQLRARRGGRVENPARDTDSVPTHPGGAGPYRICENISS